ncbi:hypothetical protein EBBID32_15540 [Sphingobium indicum BiD32]|uniref:Uncharacterized protein n=1 Tax=Sphingobium indicum BiD32 TaxID=1301087 RepID=N1MJ43_9SPHN|nr:hypothetical protein EBBID32_15540 [Sphingobium indicum BiD32]
MIRDGQSPADPDRKYFTLSTSGDISCPPTAGAPPTLSLNDLLECLI